LTLLEVDANPPIVATPSGVELGYKQFLITTVMEFVGSASLSSSSLYSSTYKVNVKRGVSALASMASTWKSNVKAFVIHVFSQPLAIIPSMP
jgi:hypothetical protein